MIKSRLIKFGATAILILGCVVTVAPAANAVEVNREAPISVTSESDLPGDAIRVFHSFVECEALVPFYMYRYFPSVAVCLPYVFGTFVLVIVRA